MQKLISKATLYFGVTQPVKKARDRISGGVCFYVRDDIGGTCEVIYSHSSESVQILCLYSSVENLAMVVIYRQPDDKSHGHPSKR